MDAFFREKRIHCIFYGTYWGLFADNDPKSAVYQLFRYVDHVSRPHHEDHVALAGVCICDLGGVVERIAYGAALAGFPNRRAELFRTP